MSNFGGGIYLAKSEDEGPDWDLQTDSTGDIKTIQGIDELKKDVAYATSVALGDSLGRRIRPAVLNDIRSTVRDVFIDEERIDNIISIDVNKTETDTIEIVSEVIASDDEVELVFEVE